jgi:hypothetical protein
MARIAQLDACVPRTQRSAISAFTRVFDALWPLRSGALQSRGPGCLRLEVTGVPVLRSGMKNAASRPGHADSSLPGLTRQSILFERLLRSMMDTRVKPAYDTANVATSCLKFLIS